MIGVSITESGTTNGYVTDVNGNFELEVAADAVLAISYTGYKRVQIDLSKDTRTDFNIQMEPDIANLDEVVVVGFGEQTKQTLVGAVSTVKGEDLLKVGSVNTDRKSTRLNSSH